MAKHEMKGSDHVDYPSDLGEALGTTEDTTHDMVFGEMTEDSPNYRNVWLHKPPLPPSPASSRPLTYRVCSLLGRLDRNSCSYDENPDWPRGPLHSRRLR